MSYDSSKKRGYSEPYGDFDIQLPQPLTFSPDVDGANDLIRTAGAQMVHRSGNYMPSWTTNLK